jgi:predicted DNA-binding transcriptional regulator
LSREEKVEADVLKGTTLKVYRFMFKEGKPVGIHDVQRGAGLSSPSLASYHVEKLLNAGLIRRQDGGYIVDRVLFENMVRVKRTLIPLQAANATFFLTALLILFTYLRPPEVTSTYVFSLAVIFVAFVASLYEMRGALSRV